MRYGNARGHRGYLCYVWCCWSLLRSGCSLPRRCSRRSIGGASANSLGRADIDSPLELMCGHRDECLLRRSCGCGTGTATRGGRICRTIHALMP